MGGICSRSLQTQNLSPPVSTYNANNETSSRHVNVVQNARSTEVHHRATYLDHELVPEKPRSTENPHIAAKNSTQFEDDDPLALYLSTMQMLTKALSNNKYDEAAQSVLQCKNAIESIVAVAFPPFSGPAAKIALEVGAYAIKALVINKNNCHSLAKCVSQTMELILANRKSLGNTEHILKIQQDLEKCLEDGLEYVKMFTEKSGWEKIFSAQADEKAFRKITGKIHEIVENLKLSLQIEDHGVLDELKNIAWQNEEKDERLREIIQHGLDLANFEQMKEVQGLLSGQNQALAQLFSNSIKQIQRPHALLKNPSMSLFWLHYAKDDEQISWSKFWEIFVCNIHTCIPGFSSEQEELRAFLAQYFGEGSQGRWLFEKCYSKEPRDLVDAVVINRAFHEDADILEALKQFFKKCKSCTEPSTGDHVAVTPQTLPPCRLPEIKLIGRQENVDSICSLLSKGARLIVVNGPDGCGKAAVACAAGRHFYSQGHLPGGAFRVDLSGITSYDRVLERILDGLQALDANPKDRQSSLRAEFMLLHKERQPFLLVLMHVETCASVTPEGCVDSFETLVCQMLEWAPTVQIILSSRVPLRGLESGLETARVHRVPVLSKADGIELLLQQAPDLRHEDASEIAQRLNYTPLLLILFGNALEQGTMTVKEARSWEHIHEQSILDKLKTFFCRTINLMKEEQTRLAALLLSLLPRSFQKANAQRLLDVEDLEDKLEFLSYYQWVELKDDDQYEMHIVAWDAGRALLKDKLKLQDLRVRYEDVQQGRHRLIQLAKENLRDATVLYATMPNYGFKKAKDNHFVVQEALSVLTKDKSLLIPEVMDSFLPMLYVDVYDAPAIRVLVADLEAKLTMEPHSLAICLLLHTFFMPHAGHDDMEKGVLKMEMALELLDGCKDDGRLAAMMWRVKGSLERDMCRYTASIESLRKARGIAETLRSSTPADILLQMEHITICAELAGTLDYVAHDDTALFTEGHETAEVGVQMAQKYLGGNHPLLALCLNNLGHYAKASHDFQGAIELYQRSLKIRLNILGANHTDVSQSYNQLALSQKEVHRFAEAAGNCEKSLDIRRRLGEENLVSNSLLTKGQVYLDWMMSEGGQAKYTNSEQAFQEARRLRVKLKNRNLVKVHDAILVLYREALARQLEDQEKIHMKVDEILAEKEECEGRTSNFTM